MTGAPDQVVRWRGSDIARWSLCAVLVLAAHVGSAAYILTRDHVISSAEPPAAIVIDLSPIVAAPASQPSELPPSPQVEKTEDLPEKLVEKPDEEEATTEALKPPEPEPEAPPAPQPQVAVAPPREPEPPVEAKPVEPKPEPKPIDTPKRPEPKKKQVKKPTPPNAPQQAPQTARAETAPVAAASMAPSNAVPAWRSMVSALLERNKRIPPGVRSRSVRGTAGVSFSIGRSGQLISVSLTRSAGDSELDQEAVALVRRVGSFPPPPPEMRGASVSLSVPIRFDVR